MNPSARTGSALVFAAFSIAAGVAPSCSAATLTAAEQTLREGKIDATVSALLPLVEADPANGQVHLLLCRAYLSEELADRAVPQCEAAVAVLRSDSVAEDWLGRAYGLQAQHAGPFAAFSLARKVRDAFEAAVRLAPNNGDAVDDLGDFYVQAPGVVGGGLDKAEALARQADGALPERSRLLRTKIAEKNKDYGTAEREFRTAAELRANRPDGWVDLADFYRRRHQSDAAVEAVRRAIEIDHPRDGSLAHAAEVLLKLKREPQLGIDALRSYLSGPSLSDDAPACKAYVTLGSLLKMKGDTAAAKMEFSKALDLARDYPPANKELASR